MTLGRRDSSGYADAGPGAAAYTAISRHWDGGWDVFVLHVRRGLIGQTRSASPSGIEAAARAYLSTLNVAPGVKIDVVNR